MRGFVHGALVLAALMTAGCGGTVPFSQSLRQRVNDSDLSRIQFYLHGDFKLFREISSSDVAVASGRVVFENGRYTEIIDFPDGTPCLVTAIIDSRRVLVSFENEGSVTFGMASRNDASILAGQHGYYVIRPLIYNDEPVQYAGNTYQLRLESFDIWIEIRRRDLETLERRRRTVQGMELRDE